MYHNLNTPSSYMLELCFGPCSLVVFIWRENDTFKGTFSLKTTKLFLSFVDYLCLHSCLCFSYHGAWSVQRSHIILALCFSDLLLISTGSKYLDMYPKRSGNVLPGSKLDLSSILKSGPVPMPNGEMPAQIQPGPICYSTSRTWTGSTLMSQLIAISTS